MRLVIKPGGRFTYLYTIKGSRADDGTTLTVSCPFRCTPGYCIPGQSAHRWRTPGSSSGGRNARWSRCTGHCHYQPRSSARYRQICISAARSFGNVIRRLCTITRRTTSLSGRRNADWCGLATAKRAVRCPLYSRGCSWTMTASRRRCASSRGTRRRPAHSSRWNRY